MLRQFFSYYRPHMKLFWVDFGCAVVSGLLELAFPPPSFRMLACECASATFRPHICARARMSRAILLCAAAG